jgi:hypothetical protein
MEMIGIIISVYDANCASCGSNFTVIGIDAYLIGMEEFDEITKQGKCTLVTWRTYLNKRGSKCEVR